MGMIDITDMMSKAMGGRTKKKKTSVKDSYDLLIGEESDKLLDDDQVVSEAIEAVVHQAFTRLDLSRIEAACLPENAASRGLLEKSGFKYEGVAQSYLQIDGRWEHQFGLRPAEGLLDEGEIADDGIFDPVGLPQGQLAAAGADGDGFCAHQ